jgi:hypothetical protein
VRFIFSGISQSSLSSVFVNLNRFSRLVPGSACLERACSLQLWLALHGCVSQVCIGKCVVDGELAMHAWVESAGYRYYYDERFGLVFGEGLDG